MRATLPLLAATMAALPALQAQQGPWPTRGWARSTPQAQGLDAAPLDSLHRRIGSGAFGNIDRLVVVRNGYLVMSERYPRDYRDVSRGRRSPIGCGSDACTDSSQLHPFNYLHPSFHPWWQGRDVHTLQSVTKSVSATLVGIAITRGEIAGTGVPLLSLLGGYDVSRTDPRLARASLADLLTMRSGIEWHEQDRPLDSTNTTLQLEGSRDWVRFTLAQPMDADPGVKWAYNSGGSHLLSAIVRGATRTDPAQYAERHLFGPLGIRDYHWKREPQGLPDGEGGLYLEAEDLAKIGYLYLRGGEWDGRRILSEDWVRAATARQADSVNAARFGYGYQWWRVDRDGVEAWAGLGFGGQFLVVLPRQNVVAVVTSWNVFGDRVAGILGPLVTTLVRAAGT